MREIEMGVRVRSVGQPEIRMQVIEGLVVIRWIEAQIKTPEAEMIPGLRVVGDSRL